MSSFLADALILPLGAECDEEEGEGLVEVVVSLVVVVAGFVDLVVVVEEFIFKLPKLGIGFALTESNKEF